MNEVAEWLIKTIAPIAGWTLVNTGPVAQFTAALAMGAAAHLGTKLVDWAIDRRHAHQTEERP